jgi:hypothetical protein
MLIPVEPTDSFDVEPGRYEATCVDARENEKRTAKGPKTYLRIVWELKGSANKSVRYLVGKNYEPSLAKDTELRDDLESWLGCFDARQFDTKTLKGKEANVTVRHIHNEGRPRPFCFVSKVEPLVIEDADESEMISP